jgi:hypothetical protein
MKDSIALKMFKGTTQKEKRRKKKMRKMNGDMKIILRIWLKINLSCIEFHYLKIAMLI